MNEILLSELKSDNTISGLIPEMTNQEYLDLKTSIDENGLRHPIDINSDNTILDGRHRVRACNSLGIESIKYNRHDLSESEAIKFVRDTAIERRHLTKEQRLNIVLNSEELVSDIQTRAKVNQRKSIENANKNNPNHKGNGLGPREPNPSKPTNTNVELGKIAGVGKSTVVRAKKVKRENPEAYERVVKGESTWSTEYNKLPTVKKPKERVSDLPEAPAKERPRKPVVDLRDEINNQSKGLTEDDRKLMRAEEDAFNLVDRCELILNSFETIKDYELFERFVSTLDTKKIIEAKNKLEKLINDGGF